MSGEDGHGTVELLQQHDPHELVRPGGGAEGDGEISLFPQARCETVGGADDEGDRRRVLGSPTLQAARERSAVHALAALVQDYRDRALRDDVGDGDRFFEHAARGIAGEFAHYGAIENQHVNHILDVSMSPARVPSAVAGEASALTRHVMDALGYVGVLCVEFFVTRDQRLLVNEIAPRPHNSGHFTIEACATSQFEQQVRAVCGLPLGSTAQARPAAMVNLLGDVWTGGEPDWAAALEVPGVKLHLYGKSDPRPGRKMGPLTALADTVDAAERIVRATRSYLQPTLVGSQNFENSHD